MVILAKVLVMIKIVSIKLNGLLIQAIMFPKGKILNIVVVIIVKLKEIKNLLMYVVLLYNH